MTKDVLVSVSGTQFSTVSSEEPVEVVTNGSYFKKNNKHYVMYEEIIDGMNIMTKNTLKFDDSAFNLIRNGAINTNMLFEENKRNITSYNTPFGSLSIGIDASRIDVQESTDEIKVDIDYSIDVNCEHLADSKITLSVKPVK